MTYRTEDGIYVRVHYRAEDDWMAEAKPTPFTSEEGVVESMANLDDIWFVFDRAPDVAVDRVLEEVRKDARKRARRRRSMG